MINENRKLILPVAGVVLAFALVFGIWQIGQAFRSPVTLPRISQAYFYDLNTKELFTAPANLTGPIETESGPFEGHPAGVRANVFTCGSPRNPDQRFIGWLEMPAPDDWPAPKVVDPELEDPSVVLIRLPKGKRWLPSTSRRAVAIMRQVEQRCGTGDSPHYCHPPSEVEQ